MLKQAAFRTPVPCDARVAVFGLALSLDATKQHQIRSSAKPQIAGR